MENGTMEKRCEMCGEGACNGACKKCSCPHHKAIPVFIILIAVTFLLGAWDILSPAAVAILWPILLAGIGVTKLMKGKCSCC